MGSVERAELIVSSLTDPLIKRVMKRAFLGCGNCARRFECLSKLVDVPRAVQLLTGPEIAKARASKVSRTAAKVFINNCSKCNRLERCVSYWLQWNKSNEYKDEVLAILKEYSQDENELASLIESIMEEQGLSSSVLLKRVAGLWLECDKGKRYTTSVTMLSGGEK